MPGPAQQRADTGDQLFGREGLDEIVIGTGIEALDTIPDAVACGQHQNRQPTACAANGFYELQAVAIGQAEIEDDRIVGHTLDMSGRVVKAGSFIDAEAAILNGCAHVAPQAGVVLDNKYPHAELLSSSPKTTLKERV